MTVRSGYPRHFPSATTLTHNRGLLSNDGRHTSREPHRHAALPAPPRGVAHVLEQELRALRTPALAGEPRLDRLLVECGCTVIDRALAIYVLRHGIDAARE